MPATLRREGDALELDLSTARGFEFSDALDKIKQVEGRRYDGTRKIWSVPAAPDKAEQIINLISPLVDPEIRTWVLESKRKAEEDLLTPLPADADVLVPWGFDRCEWQPAKVNDEKFVGLLDYQRAAVDHMVRVQRAILADDMGLGKTLEAISTVHEYLLRSLLHANQQQELPAGLSRGTSSTNSSEQSRQSPEASAAVARDYRCSEEYALRGLRDSASSRMHGLGPCQGGEGVHDREVAGHTSATRNDARADAAIRASEVRRSLPQLSSTSTLPGDGPKLVIAPASVMGGWVRELERWLEPGTFGVQLVDGYNAKKRHQQILAGIKDNLWTIINWEQLMVERIGYKVKHQGGATSQKYTWVMKEPLLEVPHVAWMDPTLDDLDFKLVRAARKQSDAHGWLAVIADEAHKAKNPQAKRSKGLHRIYGNLMLAMTGTPIMNHPGEIWSLLRWLWPEQYSSYEKFFNEYVDWYENPNLGGKIITGVKNPDSLRFELKGRLVRRTQGQVRKSLPGRRRIYFAVDLLPEQQKLYDAAKSDIWLSVKHAAAEGDESAQQFIDAAESGASPATLYRLPNGAARLVRLRQIIETPATLGGEPASALINDFIEKVEDSEPEPWLAFTEFTPTCEVVADTLTKRFGFERWTQQNRDTQKPKVAIYTGDTPNDERTMIEDDFQNGRVRVIIGTIGALQVGITLTAGHLQYWFSRGFVPAINEQGEGRQADRLGQSRTTMIYIPEATDTVAQTKVPVILERKEAIVRTVVSRDKIEEVTV